MLYYLQGLLFMITASRVASLLSFAIASAGISPVFFWIEPLPRFLFVLGFLTGLLQEKAGRWRIKNFYFNLLLLPLFIWYLLQYSRNNPVQPVVSVLTIMLAARLCGEKNNRNLMQINLLSLLCLASGSLFDLSPSFLFWLVLLLLLIPVSLVVLTFYAQDNDMRFVRAELNRVFISAILITLVTIPGMVLLFPILPRTAIPMWTFLTPSSVNSTGLSDKVEPGAASNSYSSSRLAFRAEVQRQQQPPYWRGTVFNKIEKNNSWSRQTLELPTETVIYHGSGLLQTIYPEPSSSRIIVAMDFAGEISLPRIRRAPDVVYEYPGISSKRMVYTARSFTDGIITIREGIKFDFYLRTPSNLSERTLQLAEYIRKNGRTDRERLQLAEQHFINGNYRYTTVGLPTGQDAIEQFLFESRQGHCEFFASSFAVLLRAAGIPARLVGGYLGGEFNNIGGYYIVTEDKAHVWVEVYIKEKGWIRTDPSRFAINSDAIWNKQNKTDKLHLFKLFVDSMDYRWNKTVVSYDFERQVKQIQFAGNKLQSLRGIIKSSWFIPLILLSVIVTALTIFNSRLHFFTNSREERLLRRFKRVIKKRFGEAFEVDNKGLFEIASATGDPEVLKFSNIYAASFYRDRKLEKKEMEELEKLLDCISRVQN